ncbi:CCA tRNA nucleotidyltransferase [Periweissella cryptocerci]|uniref:CCA-adding enzyme n=1 Tax=Periweissella cryptocerci TaxID=2506420 RepID=A0A4P6YWG3_9LACO|nr:CCA tRNA nucleotidyltransferase [Periweissella cryptocerci]QBO37160.1 CCA tRNA nucleotidyltransferase [Periweissella cryptocerci]
MRVENLPDEFITALPILTTITNAGYEAYFVGGSVRDTLLGKPIHDVDIATSAYPAEIKALFKKTVDTGIEHGTVMILDHGEGYETTTFRTESGYTDFRRPDEVTFVRDLSEDLKRRDFTINALAMRGNGEIVDLFAGLTDLQQGILRAVGDPKERFHEDALRMMRAVRFSAQLGFTIEANTQQAIKSEAHLLAKIAVERTNVEFSKLLLGKDAQRGLLEFAETGLYQYVPGVISEHELDIIAAATALENVRLTSDEQAWTFVVSQLGLDEAATMAFLKAWKHSNDLIKTVTNANRFIRTYKAQAVVTNWDLYSVGADLSIALSVLQITQVDFPVDQLQQAYAALPIKDKHELAISGQDLIKRGVVKPGPMMGKVLAQLEQGVVAGEMVNEPAALLAQAAKII